MTETSQISVLDEKMLLELKAGNTYEALQYVQSFIARKKKSIKPIVFSDMVFHAAKLLVEYQASSYAGTLLLWFMEGGAGEDNAFNVEKGELLETSYCDMQRLTSLLTLHPPEKAAPVLETIQKQILTLVETLPNIRSTSLGKRLTELECIVSTLFEFSCNWRMAYKFRLRLGDMKKLARVLDLWSTDGFPTERPLFFVRAIFNLLISEESDKALDLIQAANAYIVENDHPSLVAWHLAQIICELIDLPGSPNVNKAQIFEIVSKKYHDSIHQLDEKLDQLLVRIGIQCFNCKPPVNSGGLNPFAMLEALTGGKKGADGAMDMSNIMNMMASMQPGRKK